MRYLMLATAALGMTAIASVADATPISGTFTLNIWHTTAAGGLATSPDNQALPNNPLTLGAPTATGTYTGAINFVGSNVGTIGDFLMSAGGSLTLLPASAFTLTDSVSGFNVTTLYEFSGTTPFTLSGTITHDDGASLFQGGVNALPASAAAPTSAVSDAYSIAPGAFNLWYVEANGLPAQLNFDVVSTPEPISIAILGTGLLGLGMSRRRRS